MGNSFVRLDKLLVDSGLTASRERAQALILAAKVLVDGERVTKAGQKVAPDSNLQVLGEDHPFVSRGGLKLRHALQVFKLDVTDLVAMDVGASTGGFTDCLLQCGAKRVYAVDVGYGQLAWRLRQHPRVVVLERQNIRYLSKDRIPEPMQVITIDASFISLKLVIPAVVPFFDLPLFLGREDTASHQVSTQHSAPGTQRSLSDKAWLIALIKPQFEAGRDYVGKGGVVRDQKVHQSVCDGIAEYCRSSGFEVGGITPSPLLGPKGNAEFLLFATYARRQHSLDTLR